MKLNKKVLASSMAAAVALIGTVAPATGVFAATSTVKDAENVDLSTADHLGGTSGDALMGAWAQSGSETGVATAKSDAQVGVVTNVLSLDAVPDFNFGNAIPGTVINLHNNKGATPDDGNSKGYLQITDSRTTTTPGVDDAPDTVANTNDLGYTLFLTVDNFKPEASNGTKAASAADAVAAGNAFKLLFGKDNLNANAWRSTANTIAKISNESFTSDNSSSVFVTGQAGDSYGRARLDLNTDHATDIQLDVPDAADGGYDSTLTWTLKPTVTDDINA